MSAAMNFSFGSKESYEVKERSSEEIRLKGGEIHKDIVIASAELVEKVSTKTNEKYKALVIRFENSEKNFFEYTFFEPNEKSNVRWKNPNTGKESPSGFERNMLELGHIMSNYNPEALAKLQSTSFKTFDEFTKYVIIALNKIANKEKNDFKLIINKEKYAALPFCVNLNKEGQPYLSSSFLGKNLDFTPYEIDMIAKYNSLPTPVGNSNNVSTNNQGSEDVNLDLLGDDEDDDLLAGL